MVSFLFRAVASFLESINMMPSVKRGVSRFVGSYKLQQGGGELWNNGYKFELQWRARDSVSYLTSCEPLFPHL